jgi:hypothetical protein
LSNEPTNFSPVLKFEVINRLHGSNGLGAGLGKRGIEKKAREIKITKGTDKRRERERDKGADIEGKVREMDRRSR